MTDGRTGRNRLGGRAGSRPVQALNYGANWGGDQVLAFSSELHAQAFKALINVHRQGKTSPDWNMGEAEMSQFSSRDRLSSQTGRTEPLKRRDR